MSARLPARTVLALYPPAWRARYEDEVRALLDDSGAGLRSVASLAWQAVPAWLFPARQLYDRPARMRASLATVAMAWVVLAGLAAVFVQLTQAQPSLQNSTLTRHPVLQWSYWVFDSAVAVSVLAVVAGCLPLWFQMLRTAHGARRRREVARLLTPVFVPIVYLTVSIVTVSLVRRDTALSAPESVFPGQTRSVVGLADGMIGPWWFLSLVILGFTAAGVSAAGPALALRGLRPDGPAIRRATRAATLAAATMALAGAASIVAVTGLYQWAPPHVGYHEVWQLGVYLPLVLLAAVVALVSATRGIRASHSPAPSSP
jgi:hypothetical protein